MPTEKYYLYVFNINNEGVLLIRFKPGKEEPFEQCVFGWSLYSEITFWNIPLLFSTIEQAEIFCELAQFDEGVHIARWVNIKTCQKNIHLAVEF